VPAARGESGVTSGHPLRPSTESAAVPRDARRFDWGASYAPETGILPRVLTERITWFLNIRWAMIGGCGAATVVVASGVLPLPLDWRLFASVTVMLALANTVFRWATRRYPSKRRLMVAQILTDYVALSVLTYATGAIGTPIVVLFLAHIILASLFFVPRASLAMTAVGFIFAMLPLGLEISGVLPSVTLRGAIKTQVLADVIASGLYVGTIAGGFLFCWYLTSAITSSLKLREEQLEASNQLLVRLDKEKTTATLRATHELKAPFAAIKSYLYSLRDGYCGELPPEALGVVKKIGDRCDRLTDMITAVIHVSNLRTTIVNGDFEELDLGQLLLPEIEEAKVLGQPRGITLSAQHPPLPLPVHGSRRHLRTLISNLLRNAITYSHDGGLINVSLHEAKQCIVLRVCDHGIGISHENIPKIFDDFFRATNAARMNPHGNGLGLTMVKEIVKLHGATIEVTSEEGKGTCFWVWFGRVSPSTQTQTPGGDNGKDPDHR
jgi:signal transduction histidine kinase